MSSGADAFSAWWRGTPLPISTPATDPEHWRERAAQRQANLSARSKRWRLANQKLIADAVAAGQPVYLAETTDLILRLCRAGVAVIDGDPIYGSAVLPQLPLADDADECFAGADVVAVAESVNDENGDVTPWAWQVTLLLRDAAHSLKVVEPRINETRKNMKARAHTIDFSEKAPHLRAVRDDEPLEKGPRLRLTPASAIKPRPVHWVWEGRIPGGELTLTPGRGGIWKSTFHTWLIAQLTRGILPGIYRGMPKPCIIAASEDSWERTIVPRLIAAEADMDLVYKVDLVTQGDEEISISLPRDVDGLITEIEQLGAALLSVDPVMSVLREGLDTHKDRDVRQALEPLSRLADRTGCVVLGNAHFNKSSGSDPVSRIMGSAAFANVARAALGFAGDDENSVVISQVKNNLGRLDLPSLRYRIEGVTVQTDEGPAQVGKLVMLGESDRSVSDVLRDQEARGGGSGAVRAQDKAAQWLKEYLDGSEPVPSKQVLLDGTDEGFSPSTIQRARRDLGITIMQIPGTKKETTWSL